MYFGLVRGAVDPSLVLRWLCGAACPDPCPLSASGRAHRDTCWSVLLGLSELYCFALVSSSLLAGESAGVRCVDRGHRLTFPGAPVRQRELLFLLLPTLVCLLIASASPNPVDVCSAVSSKTHVQDVTGTREALNTFDMVVPVLNSLQPLDSAEAVSSAPRSKAFWKGATRFSRAEALTSVVFRIHRKLQRCCWALFSPWVKVYQYISWSCFEELSV